MAQILIRKRKHFAEDTKPATWSDLKWNGRPLRGDVVEVRPNGYWRIEWLGTGTHGWDRDAFALIQVTNWSVEDASVYQGGYWDNPENPTVWYKNRYGFPTWNTTIPWNKHLVTVNDVTADEWYYIRANLNTSVTPTDKTTL